MTVLVLLETILLAVLSVLVAGLLRAYATVLRRLHALDGGGTQFRVSPPVPAPVSREGWTTAHDLSGESLRGELVSSRVVGVEHDTVLLFLSSGCASCEVFWTELAQPVALPDDTRLVVVTQGTDAEDGAAIQELASADLDVIMSTQAWRDYEVPGSPHVVYVEGRTGRVRGEGTGQSWAQVAQLIGTEQPGSGTPGSGTPGSGTPGSGKPHRDADVEAQVDRELMAAGILPGDPRLYEDDR